MSPKTISRLWYLTGLFVLLLLVGTVALTIRASDLENAGVNATLRGASGPVLVREGPGGLDPIITILPQGTRVFVTESQEVDGRTWVLIETDQYTGWVSVENIRVSQ
ncbi:MAG: SH3 domain-containing protein [Anaerolineales bacterium]|nr:SH3 domain-containing protein [Anaerolineales bacterium]